MSQKTINGFELWTVDEIKNNKNLYGKEYLQSINGNTSSSALRIIDNWMNTINAMMGTFALDTSNKTVTGAINELKSKSDKQIENVKINGSRIDKQNNEVDINIPTKTSEIENDSHIEVEKIDDVISRETISFGDSIEIVTKVNRDENGHVLNIESKNSAFPIISTSDINVGSGNAVTSITVNNGVIRGMKEETFATKESVDNIPTHTNIEQLNKIGENENGQPTYNGQVIGGGGGGGTGTVDSIAVNGTNYTPTDGVVTLPNYPTTADDVNALNKYDASTVGSGDTWEIGQYLDMHINGNDTDYDARLYVGENSSLYITDSIGTYSINANIKNLLTDVSDLKNNVVNWKQPIVTAVNNKCGTSLTTESTGNDIATYISSSYTTCLVLVGENNLAIDKTYSASDLHYGDRNILGYLILGWDATVNINYPNPDSAVTCCVSTADFSQATVSAEFGKIYIKNKVVDEFDASQTTYKLSQGKVFIDVSGDGELSSVTLSRYTSIFAIYKNKKYSV